MYKTKEEIARENIYNAYYDEIRDHEYQQNNWKIKHHKKYLKIHSGLLLISVFFILTYLFGGLNTFSFIIWIFNLIYNTFLVIKHYKLFKKEELSTIELDKIYYPEKYLKTLRLKKFKKLNIKKTHKL